MKLGQSFSLGFTLTFCWALTAHAQSPTLTTVTPLPSGATGAAYTSPMIASGGTTPYSWTALGLPAGLTIDSHTGVIAGTPALAGVYAISVAVTGADSHTSGPQPFSIVIRQTTATSLTASPALSAAFGSVVSLTAIIVPTSTTGKVIFMDSTAILGTSTLSAGKATFSTSLLGAGVHRLKAYYEASGLNLKSNSSTLSQTIHSAAQNGFRPAINYSTGTGTSGPVFSAMGDFNGDGIADIAVANAGSSNISILLGTGSGFGAASTVAVGGNPSGIAAGDFDGDGKTDLAVANFGATSNTVAVLLGNGSGGFATAVNYKTGSGTAITRPAAVAVGDLNGDGIPDLVVANYSTGDVAVLTGAGDGTFGAASTFNAGTNSRGIAIGDFDGDGNADVAVANFGGANIGVLLGDGAGRLGTAANYSAGAGASGTVSIVAEDFNGDGRVDLAVANYNSSTVGILLGTGNGTFANATVIAAGTNPNLIAAGDFNADGLLDLVTASFAGSVSVFSGDGSGNFAAAANYGAGAGNTGTAGFAVGDFNGDGISDLLLVNQNSNNASLLLGLAKTTTSLISSVNPSTFKQSTTLSATVSPSSATGTVTFFDGATALGTSTLSNGTAAISVTTLTAGTHLLTAVFGGNTTNAASTSSTVSQTVNLGVSTNQNGQTTTVLTSSANPSRTGQSVTFTATVTPASATGTVSFTDNGGNIGSGTLNGGGIATLSTSALITGSHTIVATYEGDGSNQPSTSNSVTQVAKGTTTISLSTSPALAAAFGSVVSLSAVVLPTTTTGKVTFYNAAGVLGTSTLSGGTAALATRLLPAGLNKLTAYFLGNSTASASTSSPVTETVNSVAQNGFAGGVTYLTGAGPWGVATGDFNGDGKTDVVTANYTAGTVSVFPATGTGTLGTPSTFSVAGSPIGIAVGDFNGDGKSDLAVTCYYCSPGAVSILIGDGLGGFAAAVNYTSGIGSNPEGIAVGDFDGDGNADLAITNNGSASVSILLGTGTGTFTAGAIYSTGTHPGGIVAGDFDGDGKIDLALSSFDQGVSVLLGQGSGRFGNAVNYAAGGSGTYAIVAYDFNGDGFLDLAVPNASSDNVGVLLGTGTGAFGTASTISAGSSPEFIALGDFNGDGAIDLVTANDTSSDASILIGDGSGGFASGVSYPSGTGASGGRGVAVGDFNGDGVSDLVVSNFASDTVSVLVGLAKTTTALTSSVNPTSYNGSTTFTSTVSPSTATGTVTFRSGEVPLGTRTLSSGSATLSISTLSAGSHPVTAFYGGDSANAISSSTVTQVVNAASSTTILTSSANPAPPEQSLTLTATITPSNAAGTVTFNDNGAPIGGPQTVSGGLATLSTSALTLGSHALTAVYSGSSNINTSTSATLTQAIQNTTTNVLTSSVNPSIPGQSVTFTATISPSSAQGSVSFTDNGSSIGTGALSNGIARVSTSSLTAGSHAIIATYTGDTNYGASTSNTLSQSTKSSTTISLTTSPDLAAAFGSVVSLSAIVLPTTTTGKVTFYNAAGLLGTSTLSGGTATLSTKLLPAGANTLKAYYLGSSNAFASASSVTTETVAASPGRGFAAAVSYPAGSAPFSEAIGDFNADGKADLAIVNFSSNNISVLPGNGDGTFRTATNYDTGTGPTTVAVGDFNGDGKADLAVANSSDSSVSLLQGNGDGTFQTAVRLAVGGGPVFVTVGDFNADGQPDLVVANSLDANISVLLGNGDGTFRTPVLTYGVGIDPRAVAVGDFNGDGHADLAVPSAQDNVLSVLLGNGDGTFRTAVPYIVGSNASAVTAADFNADGKLDLVTANSSDNTLSVLIGNADGTFQNAVTWNVASSPTSVAVGDFNGDGKLDMAVPHYFGPLYVLLGSGDGTFQTPVSYTEGSQGLSAVVADFNGDGRADVAIANNGSNDVSVMLGLVPTSTSLTSSVNPTSYSGNTTLTATVSPSSATGSVAFIIGEISLGTSTLIGGSATLDIATLAAGPHSVTAFYTGDAVNAASASNTVTQTVDISPTSTFLSSTPNPSHEGDFVSLTATVSPAAATGYVIFLEDGSPISEQVALASGVASFTASGLKTGSHSLTAEYGGDSNDFSSASSPVVQAVQTVANVVLTSSVNPSSVGQSVNLTATVSPGFVTGTVTFKDGETVIGSEGIQEGGLAFQTTSFPTAGAHTLTAFYSGDSNNTSAISPDLQQTVLTATTTSVSFTPPVAWFGQAATLTASVSPSAATGRVAFYDGATMLGSGPLSNGSAVISTALLPSGGHSLRARYLGDSSYGRSTSAPLSKTIASRAQSGFGSLVPYPTGPQTIASVIGDFNADGKQDLAILDVRFGDITTGKVSVLFGNGDGTFQTAQTYTAGSSPKGLAVGDFNGDGKQDLVVADGFNGIAVLINTGSGAFGDATQYDVGEAASITVADFNSDGIADLIVSAYGSATFLQGVGDGSFMQAQFIAETPGYTTVLATDMNSDGNADLVLFGSGGDLRIFLGGGDGTFSGDTAQCCFLETNFTSVAIGDFNGDGTSDIVAGTSGSAFYFFAGNGDGSINTSPSAYGAGDRLAYVAAGDFNGDGKQDVAVADSATGTVYVLPGAGDGTFGAGTSYATSLSPLGLVAGNFSGGTGRGDLVVTDGNSFGVAVLSGLPPAVSLNCSNNTPAVAGVAYSLGCAGSSGVAPYTYSTISGTLPDGLTLHSSTGVVDGTPGATGSFTFTIQATDSDVPAQTASAAVTVQVATLLTMAASPLPTAARNASYSATLVTGGTGKYTCTVTAGALPSGLVLTPDTCVLSGTPGVNGTSTFTIAVSDSGTPPQNVSKAYTLRVAQVTTTTLTALPNPSRFGEQVTLTATVAPASAGGTVTFKDGSATLGTGDLNGEGIATLAVSNFTVGSHSLTVVYGGDSNDAGSTSPTLTQTVAKAPTTTSFSSSPNPSTFGETVTLTATIAPAAATGSITFSDGSITLGTSSLNSSGIATFSLTSLSPGPHTLVATYGGDANYLVSKSQPGTTLNFTSAVPGTLGDSTGQGTGFTVRLPGTGTSISTVDPSLTLNTGSGILALVSAATDLNGQVNIGVGEFIGVPGSSFGVTADEDFSAGVTFRNVQYSQNFDQIGLFAGTGNTSVFRGGFAFLNVPTVFATETLGNNDVGSQADPALAPNPGDDVTLTLSRTTGTWALSIQNLTTPAKSGNIPLTQPTFLNGAPDLVVGVFAANSGNSTPKTETLSAFSVSSPNQTVNQASSTTTLTSSLSPSLAGQNVRFTATVAPATASGTVTFLDGETSLGTATLSNGSATLDIATLAAGSHSITSSYAGDTDYTGSSSAVLIQLVNQTSTTTSISSSANPSAVRQEGVSFTLTVSPSTATGTVGFFINGGLVTSLPLVNGAASTGVLFTFAGSYSLTAVYSGDFRNAPSTSSVLTQVVNKVSTITSLSTSGSPSIFGQTVTLTAAVSPSTVAGPVDFYDGPNLLGSVLALSGQAELTTRFLGAGTRSIKAVFAGDVNDSPSTSPVLTQVVNANPIAGFQPPVSYTAGNNPAMIAQSDFNGDGISDLAVVDQGDTNGAGTVELFLGNSDGTFRTPSTIRFAANQNLDWIVAADFNNDGKADLAVAGRAPGKVFILRGDGAGGFGTATSYGVTSAPFQTAIAVGDFNGDGFADLAVSGDDGDVAILLNRGNATFDTTGRPAGSNPYGVAAGDFNGDGFTDLAFANFGSDNISVLFGHGDGSFGSLASYPVAAGAGPFFIAAGDLNGDGVLDLAVTNLASNGSGVSVLLGNSDGTFGTAASFFPNLLKPASLAFGDFNGDGKIDLAVSSFASSTNSVSILQGDGSGGFTSAASYAGGAYALALLVGDFNGDGRPDIATASANASSSNVTALLATAPTTTTLTSSASPSTPGQSVILTATVSPSSATGTVDFFDGANSLGSRTLSAGSASLSASTLSAGSHSLTAVYIGDASDAASTSIVLTQIVNQATSTTSLSSSANPSIYRQSVTLTAVVVPASATGTVTFKDGSATLGAGTLDINGVATLTISNIPVGARSLTAVYGGDANNAGSTSPVLTQTVGKAPTTTSISSSPNPSTFGQRVTLTATVAPAGAAGTVTFSDGATTLGTGILNGSGIATLDISNLSFGSHSLTAAYPGDESDLSSNSSAVTQTVNPATSLGASSILVSSAAGSSSVVLSVAGAWAATSNADFLHITPGSASGTGSALVTFTYDAFSGTGTRSGTLTIAGLTLTLTQAGVNYTPVTALTSLVPSGLNNPVGVAVDASGNIYFADSGNNAIKQWTASTQQITTLVSAGLNNPAGVAVDGSGNVYIADSGNNAVKEWIASTQQVITLMSSGLNNPVGVAVDGSGNVYIVDDGNNAIKEWNASSHQVTTLVSSGLLNPKGLAVDDSGNVYIADSNNLDILEWNASTQAVTTLVSTGYPQAVSVDGSGNVYFVSGNELQKWNASTQQVTIVASGLNSPAGVAVDRSGNVYIADSGNNAVRELPHTFAGPITWSNTVWTLNATGGCAETFTGPFTAGLDGLVTTSDFVGQGGCLSAPGTIFANPYRQTASSFSAGDTGGDNVTLVFANPLTSAGAALGVNTIVPGNGFLGDTQASAYKDIYGDSIGITGGTASASAQTFEPSAAGTDSLLPVVPLTQSLTGVYAPTSDQSWLTIGTVSGGVVNFSFAANTTASARTAHIGVLGQQTTVTQQAPLSITGSATMPDATFGQPYGPVSVTANGGSGSYTWAATGLPGGITIGATTGVIGGTPAVVGSFTGVVITVTDTVSGLSTPKTFTLTIDQAATATTLTSSLKPSTFGQAVTLTATVGPQGATGTVTFKDGSATLGTGTLNGGVATFNVSTFSVGAHSLTADYGGDTDYLSSSSSTLTQTVNAAPTTTSVISSVNPSILGDAVTFTAAVSPSSATGTVTFHEGETTIGTGTLAGGSTTLTIASLSVAAHSITAVYAGDTNDVGSTSSVLSQIVNPIPNLVINGDFETAIPGGRHPNIPGWSRSDNQQGSTESQFDSPVAGCGFNSAQCAQLAAGGAGATISQTLSTAPGQVYLLDYQANSSAAGQSNSLQVFWDGAEVTGLTLINSPATTWQHYRATVIAANSSVVLSFSAAAQALAWFLDDVSVTAASGLPAISSIAPPSGTATGGTSISINGVNFAGTTSVTFGGVPATDIAIGSGGASITATSPPGPVGKANVVVTTAIGDNGSSTAWTYLALATTTSLSSSVNPSTFGQSVTLTATLSPSSATGSVTFQDAGTPVGTVSVNGNGVATLVLSSFTVGSHYLTAYYGGDTNDAVSASSILTQIVNQAPTVTTLTSALNPAAFGASVTLTATIAPVSASGTVTFKDGTTTLGTSTLNNGIASLNVSTLSVATHSLTADYGGDTNDASIISSTLTQRVTAGPTTTSLTSSPNLATVGRPVTLTATVSPSSSTGTVTFKEGSTTLGTGTLSAGTTTFTTSALPAGVHSLTATYDGDTNDSASTSSPVTETIYGIIFSDNFSSGASALWANEFGNWAASGGAYDAGNPSAIPNAHSLLPFALTDFTLHADTTLTGDGGVWLRATDAADSLGVSGILLVIRPASGDIFFHDVQNGNYGPALVSAPLTPGPHTFDVTVAGNLYSVYADGAGVPILSITNSSFSSGQAGFYEAVPLGFDNFTLANASTPSSITLTSSSSPSTFGQSLTLTATLTPSAATGIVTFSDGGVALGTGTLSNGVATFSTSALSVATHALTALYGGDANYAISLSGAFTQTVSQAPAAASLTSSLSPSTFGQPVTLTAAVTPITATGQVAFKEGNNILGTGGISAGFATFTTYALAVGPHSVTAVYSGDTDYTPAASQAFTQTVNQIVSTTSLSSSTRSATYGQSIILTATVSPATATGNIAFKDGSTTLRTVAIIDGSASLSIATLSAGEHSLTAVYAGDTNDTLSASSILIQTVNQATTTTSTISSSVSPSILGQNATFSVTVSPSTATGTVTFSDGATSLGSVPLTGGAAAVSTAGLAVGSHSISAAYSGDSNYTPSNSPVFSQTVNSLVSTTTLTSSLNPSIFGQAVTLTASVSPASATGTIVFKDGDATIDARPLNGGTAALVVSALAVGPHSLTAVYGGDTNDAAGTSAVLTETVNLAPTFTSLLSSSNPSILGQTVTLTAKVLPVSVTGNIVFSDGPAVLGTVALSGGSASLQLSSLPLGAHTLTASYSGDASYAVSSSSGVSIPLQFNVSTANSIRDLAGNGTGFAARLPGTGSSIAGNDPNLTLNTAAGTLTVTATPSSPDGQVNLANADFIGIPLSSLGITGFQDFSVSALYNNVVYPQSTDQAGLFLGSSSTSMFRGGLINNGVPSAFTVQTNGTADTNLLTSATLAPSAGDTLQFTLSRTAGNYNFQILNLTNPAKSGTIPLAQPSYLSDVSNLIAGIYAITPGDTTSRTQTIGAFSVTTPVQTVNQVPTTVNLTSSLNPSTFGQTVTLNATVAPSSATGAVTFLDGSASIGAGTLSAGVASIQVSALTAGTHSLTAAYSGDSIDAANTSSALTQTVNQAPSGVSLSSSPNPSAPGKAVTLTAAVTPPTATGAVQFFEGTTSIGQANLIGGTATLSVSSLASGFHTLTGAYSGDPNFTASVSPAASQTVYRPVSISTSSLPAGQVGQSYNASLAASGGSGNFSWTATGLPQGLGISSDGTITGTATAPLNGAVSVTVNDVTSGQSDSASIALNITASPVVIGGSANLGDVAVGTSISASFSASGGVRPYTWALVGAAGLTVDSSGNVRGSASQPGSFSPTLTVTDSLNTSSSITLSLAVLGISGSFPVGTTTSDYSGSVTGVGGAPPYTYTASGVPQGLSFAGGALSGKPTAAGTYTVGVQVSDSRGATVSGRFTFTVIGVAPAVLTITITSLPDGFEGKQYSQALSANGGASDLTWSQSGGQMPAGLSLSGGTIVGTPAASSAGTYTIGLKATDTAGAQAVGTVSLKIQPAPLQISSGAALPSGQVGVEYPSQILTASGGTPPYTFSATGSLPAGLTLANGQIAGTPSATGDFTFTQVVTDSAQPPVTASLSVSTTIKPNSPDLVLSSANASFSLASGTSATPSPSTVSVSSSVISQVLAFTTSSSAPWLTAGGSPGTPGSISVGLNSAALSLSATGSPYSGTVTVTCTSQSCAGKSQSIAVTLTITAAPPQLSLGSPLLSFSSVPPNPQSSSAALSIVNAGGGSLAIQSVTAADSWIEVGTFPAAVAPGPGGSVTITANPAGLKPGYYLSSVTVTSSAGSASVPVTLLISGAAIMTLGPAGTQFSMPQAGALGNANGLFAVSVSSGNVDFTASVLPGAPWLSGGGPGTASPASSGAVSFSIDQTAAAALGTGAYYGTIRVSGSGVINSPQDFQVVLNISPAATRVIPDPQPAGVLFIGSGQVALPPQTIQLFASSKTAITYQASPSVTDGGQWLSVSPATGTTSAASAASIALTANPAGLNAGVYRGTVSFSFASAVRTVNVTLIVPAASAGTTGAAISSNGTSRRRNAPQAGPVCAGAQLVPTQTGLVSNFSAPASWPTPLAIKLVDTCGSSIAGAQIVTTFSNGDPPLILSPTDNANGVYQGTWTPRRTSSQITILARASVPGYTTATVQIPGQVAPNKAPVLAPNGTYDVFHPQVGAGLGPGNIVQIYGSDLASQTGSPTVLPLPSEVNGTSVLIGGVAAPLYYVSPGQVNAQIPFELAAGNQYQVIVNANGALTTPQPIQLTASVPAILQFASGAVVAQHLDGTLILDSSPAAPGESVVIYLTGLGATDIPVPSGTASPSSPLANVLDTPVVTMNGTRIPILFAGLTPSLVGLYQINFTIPDSFTAGNYDLAITQSGTVSNKTILQVQR